MIGKYIQILSGFNIITESYSCPNNSTKHFIYNKYNCYFVL